MPSGLFESGRGFTNLTAHLDAAISDAAGNHVEEKGIKILGVR